MLGSLLVGLTQNTLLLLAGAFVLDLAAHRRWPGVNTFPPVPFGLTLGLLGIAVMSFPGTFSSGISCYTPSILLFLAGLFFGFKPTAMAVATVAAFRLYLSGIHDGAGLAAILLPAALGIAWRSARRRPLEGMAWWELYLSGAIVHLVQLALEQMLPGKAALPDLADVVVAHLLICPLGTLLLGLLLISRLRRDKHIATRLEGERRYRNFFESNRAVILISDPDTGAIVDANPAAAAYYGWTRDVLNGKRIAEISEPQPLEPAGGERRDGEDRRPFFFRHRLADGSLRDVEVFSGPISLAGRSLTYSIVYDVTERKRVEGELYRMNAFLTSVIENIPNMVFLKAAEDLRFVRFNRAGEELLGYPREALIGKSDYDFFPKDQADFFTEKDREVLAGGTAVEISEEPLLTARRGERVVHTKKVPILDAAGRPEYLLGISEDITERRQAEAALQVGEENLRSLFNAIDESVCLLDREGILLAVNDTFLSRLGLDGANVIGRSIYDRLPPEVADRRRAFLTEVIETGRPLTFEDERQGRWFRHSLSPVPGADGAVARVAVFAMDITQRKRGEQEQQKLSERLNRAEKMEALGTLAGGVAHDLNNVLGVLVGYSELMLMEIGKDHPLRQHVENILQSGVRGTAIIQDLLTLARRGVATAEVIDLNRVVADFWSSPVFKDLQARCPGVVIRSELAADLLNLEGSPVHLEKTVMNLIANAAESVPERGEVTLRTENRYLDRPVRGYDEMREGDYVVLSVSDTGTGIPAADLEKIFEPFYTKKKMGRSGTGLGLAVVWGTVKDHRGYIDVQSRDGRGSVFTLYFPATRRTPAGEGVPASPADYRGNGETILVVDDVKEQRELAAHLLGRLNYRVRTVSSGEEAVADLKTSRADLVVLDMIMEPGLDGLQTYQRILEIRPGQKAIIVSGFSETERVRQAQALGAGAYVRKPYLQEKIALAIREELNRTLP